MLFGSDGYDSYVNYLEREQASKAFPKAAPVNSSQDVSDNIQAAADAGRGFVPGLTKASTGYTETQDATDTLAQLTRDQWEYYKKVGAPLEDTLYESYRNKNLWTDAVQNASDSTRMQYDAARGNLQRQQARYGTGLSGRQQEASGRRMGLSEAAAMVTNRNNARKMMAETDNAVMTGGSTQSVTLKSLMG